jgi:DivIVA domain-containing protein
MVPLLLVTLAFGVAAAVAVLVVRDRPVLTDDPADPRALRWPPEGPVGPEDLAAARFTVAVRGYRMDEVDRVLADAQIALAERDARIAALVRAGGDLTPSAEDPATGPSAEPGPSAGTGPERELRTDRASPSGAESATDEGASA